MKTTSHWGNFTPPRKLCAIFIGLCTNLIVVQAQIPDLGTLAKNKGASIKYVAIGSSLSAGVRNGGIYAAAQQTSFPALLAQQMGISNFKQPLLVGNGTGKKTVSVDKNGILKFQETKDFDDSQKDVSLPKITTEIDNLAVPYQKVFDIYQSDEGKVNQVYDNRSFKYLNRYSTDKQNLINYVKEKEGKIDFFTFELGFHDFIQNAVGGGYGTNIFYMTERETIGEKTLLDQLAKITPNGVILNVPDYLRFPYFKIYSLKNFSAKYPSTPVYIEHWQKTHIREANPNDIFLPKNGVIDLLSGGSTGLSIEKPLKDEDIFDSDERKFASPIGYNLLLKKFAEEHKLAYVDLFSLYNNILDGTFRDASGVSVNISYPSGNFFSADGITPTALGQAVIANEIIKTINSFYQANIPMLNLKNYINL